MHPKLSLSVALLSASLAAQSVVVPSAAATTQPAAYSNSFMFYSSTTVMPDSHSQSIYDVNDITPASAVWNSLAVRRTVSATNNPTFTANAVIVLSHSPNTIGAATTTFASNHGTLKTTVLSGSISLPAAAGTATWPAPWQAPFPFTSPFVYVKSLGLSLVVDILQTGNTGGTPWYVETTTAGSGSRANNGNAQSTCKYSNGKYNNSLTSSPPRVGGTWYVSYGSLLPNAPGFGALGVQGLGGSWGSIPLPIDLGQFNAPGCTWNISVELTTPLVADANGNARWPTLNVPNSPGVAGGVYFDHSAFLDPAANPWGVVTNWSSKWTIGTFGAPATTVYATGAAAANPTGTLLGATGATVQLN